ncbi:hypothetical protein GCM10027321_06260 [Massilia terrae]|uniref:Uncharacterized protein n=1 Tax=Massilia terrae TaxID=1811224 RepID=A0ABT2CSQ3_9BURK|nr:hypothetical protein [Massilia terrae]MCS0657015.1 hypothetical protein [Massilia terrae]
MNADAFDTLNQLFYLLSADGREPGTLVGLKPRAVREMYSEARNRLTRSGAQGMHQLELRLRTGWGWHVYLPPEARGAVIHAVIEAVKNGQNIGDNRLRQAAAFIINELLATVQSISQLNNTIDRVTSDIGLAPGRNHGVQLINSIVDRTVYADCIERCQTELIRSHPLCGRPFLRNDEREFIAASLPLHHPGYSGGLEMA